MTLSPHCANSKSPIGETYLSAVGHHDRRPHPTDGTILMICTPIGHLPESRPFERLRSLHVRVKSKMPYFGPKFSGNRGAWAGTIRRRQPRVRLELPIWVLRWLNLLSTRGSLIEFWKSGYGSTPTPTPFAIGFCFCSLRFHKEERADQRL